MATNKKMCLCVLSGWWEWFSSTNTPPCFQRALTWQFHLPFLPFTFVPWSTHNTFLLIFFSFFKSRSWDHLWLTLGGYSSQWVMSAMIGASRCAQVGEWVPWEAVPFSFFSLISQRGQNQTEEIQMPRARSTTHEQNEKNRDTEESSRPKRGGSRHVARCQDRLRRCLASRVSRRGQKTHRTNLSLQYSAQGSDWQVRHYGKEAWTRADSFHRQYFVFKLKRYS